MPVVTAIPRNRVLADLPIIATDTPIMFEDEGQEEMGDSYPHTTAESIVYFGLIAFFSSRPDHYVFADLNLHYSTLREAAYVSPDVMVVIPPAPLSDDIASYHIGEQGPAPVFVTEVLSRRTAQQGDLTLKPEIYADINVPEYCLIDPTGKFLKSRLEFRTLVGERKWQINPDRGEGVTSKLGFRIGMEVDGWPRVYDATTGRKIPRPDEVTEVAMARAEAEAKLKDRDAEIARLRALLEEKNK
jgi:Uma2 family endonuclease